MRILGIDPGLNTTGYGMLEIVNGRLGVEPNLGLTL